MSIYRILTPEGKYNVPRDVPRLIGGGFHFRLKAERANRRLLALQLSEKWFFASKTIFLQV
jgi:hypothetical protein